MSSYFFSLLLISIFFIFPKITFAEGDSYLTKNSNPVYQFINDHEYLIVPLANAAAGLSYCGPWCALATGVGGMAEGLLLNYKYIDQHYFTYAVLGNAMGNVFTPALTGTGMMIGLYLSGAFAGNEALVGPAFTATLGMQAEGVPGLVLSSVGSIIDESFREANITDKHPVISFMLVPKFLYDTLGAGIASLVTVVLNALIYNDQTLSGVLKSKSFAATNAVMPMGEITQNYTRAAMKLYDNYSKFIPQEEFKKNLENYLISLIGSQLFIRWLVVKEILLNQNLVYHFEHLNQRDLGGVAGNPLVAHGIKFAIFLIPWSIGQVVTNSIEKYYNDQLNNIIQDNLQKKFYAQENPSRLANHGNFSLYMDNLNRDIAVVSNFGSSLFSDTVSTSVSGAYATSIIVIHSRSILAYTALYELVSLLIMQHLAAQSMAYDEELKFLNSEILDLYKDTKTHVRTIAERDGFNVTGSRVRELATALVDTQSKTNLWYMASQLYMKAYKTLGTILNYGLVYREIAQGQLSFENRNILGKAVMDESNMFSWASRNLVTVGQFEKSLDRLIVIEGVIDQSPSSLDQIKRIDQAGDQLILHNLEIGVGDRVLATIDDLKLNRGEVYAITGETGCGKTSLLTKIKGIKENGVYGSGEIYYPRVNNQEPKIVMLSQQDYFPPNSTLEEVLIYPDKIATNSEINKPQRAEMVTLLREMGLSRLTTQNLNLDSRQNWYQFLSGGEKKKVLIISAILKKPDILILDEIFNGLDLDSIKVVQRTLKKYLSNTLILAVDHHATANNFSFYDHEIHFNDKKLVLQDFSATK